MDKGAPMNAIDSEDEAGGRWSDGVAKEWAADLGDPRQDLYTSDDGQPVGRDPSSLSKPGPPKSES